MWYEEVGYDAQAIRRLDRKARNALYQKWYYLKNKEKMLEYRSRRYHDDPTYREAIKQRRRERFEQERREKKPARAANNAK